jgi:hypothetical protein
MLDVFFMLCYYSVMGNSKVSRIGLSMNPEDMVLMRKLKRAMKETHGSLTYSALVRLSLRVLALNVGEAVK